MPFTAGWCHDLRVEQIRATTPGRRLPVYRWTTRGTTGGLRRGVGLPERTQPHHVLAATLPAGEIAGLVSYGLSADLLGAILPLGRALHATTLRRHVQAVAQRLEDDLGDEQPGFLTGCPAEWAELPRPDLPLVVGLDGGCVHSCTQRSHRDGWFEVIPGRTVPAGGDSSCFGYVQTYDTKPKRRLFEALKAQGMQPNQQVTFLTDGGEDIRDLPCYLNPQAEDLLDWFHLTMRITVLSNMAKCLSPPPPDPEYPAAALPDPATEVSAQLQRLKWFCWHRNVLRALQIVEDIAFDLDIDIAVWRRPD